jgi:hydroxyethylthiazole kinase-like uncharacterized protein yjeF
MTKTSSVDLAALLPIPEANANKYTRGKLTLVVGGSSYPGAAFLATRAAQRAGAGYCEVFTAQQNVSLIQTCAPSSVVRSWDQLDELGINPSNDHHPTACVVGSGFDPDDEEARSQLAYVLQHAEAPVLVDGGAIRMLATEGFREMVLARGQHGFATVITPHTGEAIALAAALPSGMDKTLSLATCLADAFRATIVLKGPNTEIISGDKRYLMTEGTAALSKAGTGDVLAGIIGSLLAQRLDAFSAAVLGTTLHARAGLRAEKDRGIISVLPEDVVDALPAAIMATMKK